MDKKLSLKRIGGTFGTLRYDEKHFFKTLLGYTPYFDYKPTNDFNAISPGVYIVKKILILVQ